MTFLIHVDIYLASLILTVNPESISESKMSVPLCGFWFGVTCWLESAVYPLNSAHNSVAVLTVQYVNYPTNPYLEWKAGNYRWWSMTVSVHALQKIFSHLVACQPPGEPVSSHTARGLHRRTWTQGLTSGSKKTRPWSDSADHDVMEVFWGYNSESAAGK